MPFMQLTLLYCLLIFFAGDQASEYAPSSETKIAEPIKEAEATNIILQSKDGGQTWQDITHGLPETKDRVAFYAGTSEVYLSTKGAMYRSKSNLKTPVWEKENVPYLRSTSIVFSPSGVIAYSYDGHIYQKKPSSDPDRSREWLPIYTSLKSTNLERHEVATLFEASDGTVFRSTGRSFSKSTDKARSWKLLQKGWVGNIVESEGVLMAAGQQGIMRSTDNGEHWEWVISEGGWHGIAVERIDGGFAAIAYNTQTKSRSIFISMDSGKTWKAIDKGLLPSSLISSVKQMGSDLFVGHPDGIFRSSDGGKTWLRVHAGFGNELHASRFVSLNSAPVPVKKVFTIYVSGTVLYAVAVTPGC
jgi:photosystem II stability/assembly factor-like uncharacterized protein